MKRSVALLSGIAIVAAALSLPAFAQGKPQTLSMTKVDPATLTTGYRTSKVVGSTVYNDSGEAIGTIDDLIVTPTAKVPYAVLSVGGFLGMGTRLVVVPIDTLEVKDKRMVLHDATKDSLKLLPAFVYAG
jgi:sporulation protein YlmC with PRC-barrel domain